MRDKGWGGVGWGGRGPPGLVKLASRGLGHLTARIPSLMAAEVMWTPEEEYDSLTPQEVNLEYPALIPL
jgi:uncharacterized membrane protein